MSAIGIAFFILWVALAMWVYFDASEHGKPAILWALAVFLVGWALLVPLGLYAIFRDSGHRWEVAPGAGRRLYLYVVSFSGLVTVVLGLSLIISTSISRAVSSDGISDDGYRESLAAGLAAVVVGGVVWAIHWFRTERRLPTINDDKEFRASFYLHRSYLYTSFGLLGITSFVSVLWLLGGGLTDLFGTEEVELHHWLPALGPIAVAMAATGYHFIVHFTTPRFKELQARFDTVPPPRRIVPGGEIGVPSAPAPDRTPEPPSRPEAPRPAGQFCIDCGAKASPSARFCGSCGAQIQAG